MTFSEVCAECLANDELVREWNRLTRHRLGVSRPPAVQMTDKACGYDPDKDAMPDFISFVWGYIWLPLANK
jgi:hypothetical protein